MTTTTVALSETYRCAACSSRATVVVHHVTEACPTATLPAPSDLPASGDARHALSAHADLGRALSTLDLPLAAQVSIREAQSRHLMRALDLADARRAYLATTAGDLYDHHGRRVQPRR